MLSKSYHKVKTDGRNRSFGWIFVRFSDVVTSEMALSNDYNPELSDSSSQEFKNLSTQFCDAVCIMYFGASFV